MDGTDVRYCPICRAELEFISRYYLWRCGQDGLFQDQQLQPHEQIKIGEFTWMCKDGKIFVNRPAYHVS